MSAAVEQVQVQIDVGQIRAALKHDRKFFIEFFLGDELTLPVPDFHVEVFNDMVSETLHVTNADGEAAEIEANQIAIAIPREHAKTTLAKLACLYYILFSDFTFIAYLSNTLEVAIPATNDVIGFLECDNFKAVFGELAWVIRRDGKGYYVFNIPALDKTIRLKAYGAGQQIRGVNVRHRRPQLAIVDDVESAEGDIAKQIPYEQLKKWFYGTFKKALDQAKQKIIQIGNLVAQESLLDLHCKSEFWVSRRYGCLLSNGQPLWPDKWTIAALAKDFHEYMLAGETETWFAEMMNIPMPKGGGLIKAKEITYAPPRLPEEAKFGFLTIDLAISKETWAHKTVISVHGYYEEVDQWQTVDHRMFHGIDPIQLFWQTLKLCYYWNFWVIGIESVAYQASLQPVFRYLALEAGLFNDEITFIPIPVTQKKLIRLITWAGLLKSAQWALTQNDFVFTNQLLRYEPIKGDKNEDDAIDSAAHGVYMTRFHLPEIMMQKQPHLESLSRVRPLVQFAAI